MDSKKFISLLEEKKKRVLEKKQAPLKWEQRLEAAAKEKSEEREERKARKKHKRRSSDSSSSDYSDKERQAEGKSRKKHKSSDPDLSNSSDLDKEESRKRQRRHRRKHLKKSRKPLTSSCSNGESEARRIDDNRSHRRSRKHRREHPYTDSDSTLDSHKGPNLSKKQLSTGQGYSTDSDSPGKAGDPTQSKRHKEGHHRHRHHHEHHRHRHHHRRDDVNGKGVERSNSPENIISKDEA